MEKKLPTVSEAKALLAHVTATMMSVTEAIETREMKGHELNEADYRDLTKLVLMLGASVMKADSHLEKYGRRTPSSKYFVSRMDSRCLVCGEVLEGAHQHTVDELIKVSK